MRKTKAAAIVLAGILAFSLLGCGGKVDRTLTPYESDKSFRFAAYISPPPAGVGEGSLANNENHITAEDYRVMKECGFDYAYSGYLRGEQDVLAALEVLDEVGGIKYLVRDDPDLNAMLYDTTHTANWDEHKQNVQRKWALYGAHESFGGAMAIDEPNANLFGNIRAVKDWYTQTFLDFEYNTNLLPNWASEAQLGSADYETHVSDFIRTVQPTQLSYDYYPFIERNGQQAFFRSQYFSNLETIAYAAKEAGVPFYVYLLTLKHLTYAEMTHYSDIAWQVYNAMTFGCRGAQTFTYWTLMQEGQTGVVDGYGRPTACYYAMQEVIKEVRAMEKVFMNFSWQGTMAYTADEDVPNMQLRTMTRTLESTPRIASYSSDEDIVIGTFRDGEGADGFMVTNVTLPADRKTATVKLKFKDAKRVEIYAKGRSFVRKLDKGKLTLKVGPGEGWFVIPR